MALAQIEQWEESLGMETLLEWWHYNSVGKDGKDKWLSIWKKLNSNFTPYTKTSSNWMKNKYEKQTFSF